MLLAQTKPSKPSSHNERGNISVWFRSLNVIDDKIASGAFVVSQINSYLGELLHPDRLIFREVPPVQCELEVVSPFQFRFILSKSIEMV